MSIPSDACVCVGPGARGWLDMPADDIKIIRCRHVSLSSSSSSGDSNQRLILTFRIDESFHFRYTFFLPRNREATYSVAGALQSDQLKGSSNDALQFFVAKVNRNIESGRFVTESGIEKYFCLVGQEFHSEIHTQTVNRFLSKLPNPE